jgi:hypothetical protein
MRWKSKKPIPGHTRERSFFAFLPARTGLETRWLERVTVLQQYVPDGEGYSGNGFMWKNIHFIDPPK